MRPVHVMRQQSESVYGNPFFTDYSPMGNVPYPLYGQAQIQPNQMDPWGGPPQAFQHTYQPQYPFYGGEAGAAGYGLNQGYEQQAPMFGQPYNPYQPAYSPNIPAMPPMPNAYINPNLSEKENHSPFMNPLQAKKGAQAKQYPNPYPKQSFLQKPQPSGFQSIMNQFKTQDGSVDVTKMMNTAGQMMGTVTQVQNMVKGFGGIFKAST